MSDDVYVAISLALAGLSIALLLWNLNLLIQNMRLRVEMMQRERWHDRELAKWRERI